MKVFKTVADLHSELEKFRSEKLKTGFIPTMGALHEGHLSLVRRAKSECEKVIVSIFVNPTQFNNPDDLEKYPRMPEKDFEMLESAGVDVVFYPDDREIYPGGKEGKAAFNFGKLEDVMEGKFRPGHFKGVGQVVSRLFEIVLPHNAYFGEKDFQQLAVIRDLVRQKRYPINIVASSTIREIDGLAMSSRNLLLETRMRNEAPVIAKALFYIRDNRSKKSLKELKHEAISMIEKNELLKVEYLEVADPKTMQPVESWNDHGALRCLTAVQAGNIRLIDNVEV